MADPPYRAAHILEILTPASVDAGEAPWRAVRMAFGNGSFVRDHGVVGGATTHEPVTTAPAVGGEPGKAYEISPWEREYVGRG